MSGQTQQLQGRKGIALQNFGRTGVSQDRDVALGDLRQMILESNFIKQRQNQFERMRNRAIKIENEGGDGGSGNHIWGAIPRDETLW